MSGDPQQPRPGLDTLFARAQTGDEDAWKELFAQSYDKVRRVVRRKLNRPMRSMFDSTDFANDVFKSLVAKSNRFEFPNFDALMAFLYQEAERKVIDEYRKQHTDKRDIDRVLSFDAGGADGETIEPAAADPTPSQVFVAEEVRDQILVGQSEEDAQVIVLKGQDHDNQEVAKLTGLHVRKVQRIIKKLHDSWFAADGGRR